MGFGLATNCVARSSADLTVHRTVIQHRFPFSSRSLLGSYLLLSCPHFWVFPLVEMMGFEPMTPCLQGRCSPNWATPPFGVLYFASGTLVRFPMCWHRPIFPCSLPQSIFGTAKLNFCVRNGNRWTLCVNNTNSSESLWSWKLNNSHSLESVKHISQIRSTLL